jgi:hypothetical protein
VLLLAASWLDSAAGEAGHLGAYPQAQALAEFVVDHCRQGGGGNKQPERRNQQAVVDN